MSKAQVATEYVAIVGFVLLAVIFLSVASYFYQSKITDQAVLNQVDRLARNLVDTAESIYFLGEPSKTTIKVNIPKGVDSIAITENTISFRVQTSRGLTDVSYSSSVDLRGYIDKFEGLHHITLEAKCEDLVGCYVDING